MRFSSFHPATTGVQGSAPSNIGTIADVTGAPSISATTSITKDGVVKVYLSGSWSSVADASSYDIEIHKGNTWVISSPLASINNFELEVNPTSPYTYKIRVKAVNKNGVRSAAYSPYSNEIIASGDLTAPGVVTGVTAESADFRSIILSWTNPTDSDLSYVEIQHSLNNVDFTVIGKITGTRFTHHKRTEGTTNYYRLRAIDNSSNASAYSSVVSVALPAIFYDTIPSNVSGTITLFTVSSIALDGTENSTLRGSWTAVSNAKSYDIEITDVTIPLSPISWVISSPDAGIKNVPVVTGRTYKIRVKAVNSVEVRSPDWSPNSDAITAGGDTTAPAQVTSLNVIGGMSTIKFTWTDPADLDFSHIKIYGGTSSTTKINVLPEGKWVSPGGKFEYTHSKWGETIYFWVVTVDYSGNESTGVASGPISLPIFNPGASGWNSTNDGAGSGLDADLLDGYDSADFLRKSETPTITSTWSFVSNASVSASDYYGASTWTQILSANSVSTQAALALRAKASSGNFATGSLHVVPVAEYRSGLVATYSADGSGAGYFAVNQFVPTSSTTLERLRVNVDGKLLIGAVTPVGDERVNINGRLRVGSFQSYNVGNAATLYGAENTNTETSLQLHQAGVASVRLGSKANDANIYLTNDYNGNGLGNAATSITISSIGNIGIGTTTPATKVHVVGQLKVETGVFDLDSGYSIRWGGAASGIYSGSGTSDMIFTVGSSERFRINGSSGNFGIGTTSPAGALDVFKNITYSSIDTYTQLVIGNVGGATGKRLNIGYDDTANIGFLQAVNRGVAATNLVLQRYAGNVGIGTASPSVKLDVVGGDNDGLQYRTSTRAVGLGMQSAEAAVYWGSGTRLNFTSGGAIPMTILADGKVGIGTTAPVSKLGVVGGDLSIGDVSFSNNNNIVFYGKNGSSTVETNYIGFVNGYEPGQLAAKISFLRGGSSQDGILAFNTRAQGSALEERMRILADGNVGIGTTSPQGKLQILTSGSLGADTDSNNEVIITGPNRYASGSLGNLFIMSNSTPADNAGGSLTLGGIYSGTNVAAFGKIMGVREANSFTGALTFHSRKSDGAMPERMRINRDGNVGIGTTAPAKTLHVYDATAVVGNPTIRLESLQGGYGAGVEAGSRVSGGSYLALGKIVWDGEGPWDVNTATQDSYFRIFNTYGGALLERFRITAYGDVGIGVTNPGAKIDTLTTTGATGVNTIVARFNKNSTNGAGSSILRLTSDGVSSDFETNSASSGGSFRFSSNYGDTNIANLINATNGPYGNINFVTNSAIRMTIGAGTQAGNVGIGTTSPGQKLEVVGNYVVRGSEGYSIYTWTNADSNWRIGMGITTGFTKSMATGHTQYVTYSNGAGQGFATGVGGGNSSFEIQGSDHKAYFRGYVGMGITPDSALHVQSPGSVAGLRIGYNGGSSNYYDADAHYFRNAAGTQAMSLTTGAMNVNGSITTAGSFYATASGTSVGIQLEGYVADGSYNSFILNNTPNTGSYAALHFGRLTNNLFGFIRSNNNAQTMEIGTAGLSRISIAQNGAVSVNGAFSHTGIITNAGGIKTYSVSTLGQGNVNSRYELMRISRDPLNWSPNISYEITAYSKYYRSGGRTKWLVSYGYDSTGMISCIDARGTGKFRVYLGTEVAINANVAYIPVYVDIPEYNEVSIEVKFSTNVVTSITDEQQVHFTGTMTTGTGALYSGDTHLVPDGGNVGIGTTSPSQKLDVAGNAYISGRIGIGAAPSTTVPLKIVAPAIGDWTVHVIGSTASSQSYGIIVDAGTTSNDWNFYARNTSGGFLAGLRGDGNFGIGTSSPGDKLEVSGNVFANAFNAIGGPSRYNATGGTYIAGNAGSAYGEIRSYSDAGGGARILAINPTGGNVGIGTTTPSQKLHVTSSIANNVIQDALLIDTTVTGGSSPSYYGAIRFRGNDYDWGAIRNIQTNPSASWASRMAFFTMNGAGGALAERACIDNSGFFGVGVTNPWTTMDVTGSGVGGSGWSGRFGNVGNSIGLLLGYRGGIAAIGAQNALNLAIAPDGGKVGIGTTAPDGTLTVFNSATFDVRTSGINVHRPSSYGQFGSMSYDGDTTFFASTYTGGGAGQGGAFRFLSYDNSSAVDRLFIARATGNVGIGTISPSQKLHVDGMTQTTALYNTNWNRSQTAYGYIDFGPANEGHGHIYTDRPTFYFNKEIFINGGTVWHSGNDGTGSGLDADLLDGLQASAFMQLAGVQTATGRKTFNSSAGTVAGDFNANSYLNSAMEVYNGDGNRAAYMSFHITGIAGVKFGLNTNAWLATDAAGMTINGNTTWHAGNDGAGSGLDADLWDGYQFATYLNQAVRTDASPTFANVTASTFNGAATSSGHVYSTRNTPDSALQYWQASGLGITEAPDGDWYNTIRMGHGSPLTYYSNTLAVRMTGAGVGDIYTQTIINGTRQGWKKFWNDGNDGAGSGLDADLLKGKTIAESTVGDTIVSRNGGGRFSAAGIDFLGSSQGDLVNNSPWYGVGKSDITSFGGGGNVIQMAGYYGLRIRSPNATMDFYQNGRIITAVPANKDFRVDGILNATRGIVDYSVDDNSSRPARILIPEGGARVGSAGSETGAIKIELPADRYVGNSMMTFTVCIYEYTTGRTRRILCGGYNYSYWVYTSAIQQTESGGNINVRFGRQSSRDCVWVGETNTVWNYPQVWIEDVNIGYSGFSNAWATGWAISLVTSFGTVENTHVAYAQWHGGNDGSGSGLDADLLDGYHANTTAESANTIPVRDSSGWLNQRVIRNINSGSDGMYIGYGNSNSGITRIYGGGSTSTHLSITTSSMTTPGEVYTPSGSYFRAVGTGGFYCETYNGGWNMTDGTWLRSIADKGILTGGAIQGATVTATSDLRLKSDIQPLANFSEVIDTTNVYSFIKDGIRQWGVIAQEVLNTPAALLVHEGGTVFHDGTPILTVDFAGFTYALLAEVKELRKRVAILEKK